MNGLILIEEKGEMYDGNRTRKNQRLNQCKGSQRIDQGDGDGREEEMVLFGLIGENQWKQQEKDQE